MSKRPMQDASSPASTPKKKKFQTSWTSEFQGIKCSEKGENFAFCTSCNSHFSVIAGGKNDVSRHVKGSGHITNASASKSMPKLTSLFKDSKSDTVTKAEVLFANFIAEHNLPFSVADHFTHLCSKMFPDSDIAKKFSAKRTKTTHILNMAIAPSVDKKVTNMCRTEKFSIMMDESNDKGDEKCVAILVRVLDRTVRKVVTRFLSMPICNIGTAANLFDCLNDVFISKRKEIYKEFLDFTDTEAKKIVKHCATRWLSLEKCVRRLLQQWPALKSYFKSHEDNEKSGRVQRCAVALDDPEMELTYHFLAYILGPLNEFNTTFQAGDAMIGYLHAEMVRLLRKFLGKFVLTKVITSCPVVTEVDFKTTDNQHPDDNLAVGMEARRYLAENPDLPREKVQSFFRSVRRLYVEVTDKMINKFPFHDSTLKTLGFLNPDLRQAVAASSVVEIAQRFDVCPDASALEEEYQDYQLTPTGELPDFEASKTPLDEYWFQLHDIKLPTGKSRFQHLSNIAFVALSLPHSNADPERAFSMVRKIQTDQRGTLGNTSLNSLLSCKINLDCDCYMYAPSSEVLREAKSACSSYMNKIIRDSGDDRSFD